MPLEVSLAVLFYYLKAHTDEVSLILACWSDLLNFVLICCQSWITIWKGLSWSWSYMVVEFTTTYAIGAYHHWRGFTTLYDQVCQWLAAGQWVFSGSSGFLHQ
jgi:hypothetical protein